MSEIICKCGSTNYRIEKKANNHTAYCNECGKYIKNVPYSEPTFYVGKYKDVPIKEITDLSYLSWAIANMQKLTASTREAINSRIQILTSQS